jgi:hypothetical protein
VQAGEPARAVGIVDQWLGAAAPEQKGAMLELALDVAEALVAAQRPQEGGQVLDLVAKHAGAEPGSRIASRMERLRRQIGS